MPTRVKKKSKATRTRSRATRLSPRTRKQIDS